MSGGETEHWSGPVTLVRIDRLERLEGLTVSRAPGRVPGMHLFAPQKIGSLQ
jgi:hypothetical protein